MNPQTAAFTLLVILACMVIVWFVLCKLLFNRLQRDHPQKYEAMGQPSLFLRNNIANNLATFKFLVRREYATLNDAYVTKLANTMRVYFVVYVLLFIVLFVMVAHVVPATAA